MTCVALRKESVDRNIKADVSYNIKRPSLSARRAWIEMAVLCLSFVLLLVALRKESVDRNIFNVFLVCMKEGRSPQGERG